MAEISYVYAGTVRSADGGGAGDCYPVACG